MPLQTTLENLDQKLTQMGVAGHAVGLDHHRKELSAYRRRTREGHVASARAMGEELAECEADDVGDLTITGDIQYGHAEPQHSRKLPAVGAAVAGASVPLLMLLGHWLAGKEESVTVIDATTTATTHTLRPDELP